METFREFIFRRHPEIIQNTPEVLYCPSQIDFEEYFQNTACPDFSGVNFPPNIPFLICNKSFVIFHAEDMVFEGGISLENITVKDEISFDESLVKNCFKLNHITCGKLIKPKTLIGCNENILELRETF